MVSGRPQGFTALGIDENDFISNEETDFGRAATWQVRTGTIDFRGNEQESFSSGSSITIVFHDRSANRTRGPDGMFNQSPAYMMVRTSIGIGTGDRIVIDGRTWRVFNVINRDGIFKYSELYLVE